MPQKEIDVDPLDEADLDALEAEAKALNIPVNQLYQELLRDAIRRERSERVKPNDQNQH